MTCREALSYLDDYIDNDLDPALMAQVRRHLDDCVECQTELEASKRLRLLFKAGHPPEPRADYWPELSSLILAKTTENDSASIPKTESRPSPEDRRDLVRSSLALAASICILLGALYLGSQKAQQARQFNPLDAPVLVTASLGGLVGGSPNAILTKREYTNLVAGRMLIGFPGPLAKSMGLIDMLTF